MNKPVEILTYSVDFFGKDGQEQTVVFSSYVDRNVYDDPKEFVIDYVTLNLASIKRDTGLGDLLPRFKSVQFLNSRPQ